MFCMDQLASFLFMYACMSMHLSLSLLTATVLTGRSKSVKKEMMFDLKERLLVVSVCLTGGRNAFDFDGDDDDD